MRLYTSSSKSYWHRQKWLLLFLSALITVTLLLVVVEILLQTSGWKPSLSDSQRLWAYNRKKASEHGSKAIVFIGASRIQLGIDLKVVTEMTHKIPLQLAIERTSFMPVLENLAEDQNFLGTVVVSPVNMGIGKNYSKSSKSYTWVREYERQLVHSAAPFEKFDFLFCNFLNRNLASRMYGARPYTVISRNIFSSYNGGYIYTSSNRSRSADYRGAPDSRKFYESRLVKHLGGRIPRDVSTYEQFMSWIKEEIAQIRVEDNAPFKENLFYLLEVINTIESRGGKVLFIRFPTDKLIWEIDKKRYPRSNFWNLLTKAHPESFHFEDYPTLSTFDLPDGSHLDMRDKEAFTRELITIIASHL